MRGFKIRLVLNIDLNNIYKNCKTIKNNINGSKLCAVVKADAYGHGMLKVCNKIQKLADFFAVATAGEAKACRENFQDANILLLSGFENFEAEFLVKNNIHLTVFDFKTIYLLDKIAKKLNLKCFVHVKFDSGMNRLGYKTKHERNNIIKALRECDNVVLKGIYTHFPSGGIKHREMLLNEKFKFENEIKYFKNFENLIIHAAATGTAFLNLGLTYDMVRVGLGIYGLNANDDYKTHLGLVPSLELKAKILQVKKVKKHDTIGYNYNYTVSSDGKIAVIACGYADGFFRSNSNAGTVVIGNKAFRICGNVCMDLFMADCSGSKNTKFAYLISEKYKDYIGIEAVAKRNNTIPYEIMTSLKRCERVYHG